MCCLTLYILSVWKSLQPQSSRNQAAVPLALLTVLRKDPSQEMKIKADPTSENENIPCWRSLLYTGFKNSLTLLCTCRDMVFGVTYGCISASLVLSVSLQGPTPLAISQKRELQSLGKLGARASGSKGVVVTHKETAGWGKNHILWLGNTVKGLWKVRSGKKLTSRLKGAAITYWFPHVLLCPLPYKFLKEPERNEKYGCGSRDLKRGSLCILG